MFLSVMTALVAVIHDLGRVATERMKSWMAGTRPAMTVLGAMGAFNGPALSAVLTALVAVIHDLERWPNLEHLFLHHSKIFPHDLLRFCGIGPKQNLFRRPQDKASLRF